MSARTFWSERVGRWVVKGVGRKKWGRDEMWLYSFAEFEKCGSYKTVLKDNLCVYCAEILISCCSLCVGFF